MLLIRTTADGLLDLALDGTELRRTLPGGRRARRGRRLGHRGRLGDGAGVGGGHRALDGVAPRCMTRPRRRAGPRRHQRRPGRRGGRPRRTGPGRPVRRRPHTLVGWTTPWGGPPDTRSLARGADGPHAGVHVGGVWRRGPGRVDRGGPRPRPTTTRWGDRGRAGGRGRRRRGGPGRRRRRGHTGCGATTACTPRYCRAAAIADGWLLASASTGGPRTARAPSTGGPSTTPRPRSPAAAAGTTATSPASFPRNVDTFSLAAAGALVAVGTPTGGLYLSEDSRGQLAPSAHPPARGALRQLRALSRADHRTAARLTCRRARRARGCPWWTGPRRPRRAPRPAGSGRRP